MKRALVLSIFVATAAIPVLASAGTKTSHPVSIDSVNRRASGSTGSTRNTSPSGSYIGCQVLANGASVSMLCSARVGGSSPVFKSCSSSAASMVTAAAAITTDSDIYFGWDASGVCTILYSSNYSDNEPKAP